jgi:hypothetical protein
VRHRCQAVAGELLQVGSRAADGADEERLYGHSGRGHDRQPFAIFVHDPRSARLLFGVVAEQSSMVPAVVASLCRIFLGRLPRDGRTGPDLAMWVGVRRAHGGPAVLEDLDPAEVSPKLGRLLGPDIDDPAEVIERELPEVEIVSGRETEHATCPHLGLGPQQASLVR